MAYDAGVKRKFPSGAVVVMSSFQQRGSRGRKPYHPFTLVFDFYPTPGGWVVFFDWERADGSTPIYIYGYYGSYDEAVQAYLNLNNEPLIPGAGATGGKLFNADTRARLVDVLY